MKIMANTSAALWAARASKGHRIIEPKYPNSDPMHRLIVPVSRIARALKPLWSRFLRSPIVENTNTQMTRRVIATHVAKSLRIIDLRFGWNRSYRWHEIFSRSVTIGVSISLMFTAQISAGLCSFLTDTVLYKRNDGWQIMRSGVQALPRSWDTWRVDIPTAISANIEK